MARRASNVIHSFTSSNQAFPSWRSFHPILLSNGDESANSNCVACHVLPPQVPSRTDGNQRDEKCPTIRMETTAIGTRGVAWRARARRTVHVPRRSALPHPGEVVQNFGQIAAGVAAVRVASRWYRKRAESKVEETNEREKWAKLLVSIAVDVVGWSSFVLPGVGEVEDVVWAPVSAAMVQALYGNRLLTGIDFVKEALPFTDVLPTATVGWAIQYTPLGSFVPTNRKEKNKPEKGG